MRRLSHRRLAALLVILALALWQWEAPWLFPLKVLMTLIHEFGHGLAALLTGGSIDRITVEPGLGGLCYTRGGWRWVILPAGYLGSMAAGCGMILVSSRTRLDRYLSLTMGAAILAATVLFVRSRVGFGYGLLTGAALASAGWWLSEELNDFLLCFLGTMSCLSAVFGLKYLATYSGNNDALMFSAEIFPLPALVWAVLWAMLAVVCWAWTLRLAVDGAQAPP